MLQPHRDVKPIEDWRIGDAGGGQYGSETGASIGETGQLRVAGPANGIELPADQRDDVGIGSDDGSENLASSNLRLDIENSDLQMPFAVLTATDEGRVQADGDRRRRCHQRDHSATVKLPAEFQGMAAQCLKAFSGIDREHLLEHARGDAIGHQGRKMGLQLIQFWRRPTIRWGVVQNWPVLGDTDNRDPAAG